MIHCGQPVDRIPSRRFDSWIPWRESEIVIRDLRLDG